MAVCSSSHGFAMLATLCDSSCPLRNPRLACAAGGGQLVPNEKASRYARNGQSSGENLPSPFQSGQRNQFELVCVAGQPPLAAGCAAAAMLSPRTTALIVAFALLAGARANEGPRTELLDGVPTPEHLGKVDEVTVTTEDPPTPPEPTPKPLPSCADATNCFDCFLQQAYRPPQATGAAPLVAAGLPARAWPTVLALTCERSRRRRNVTPILLASLYASHAGGVHRTTRATGPRM